MQQKKVEASSHLKRLYTICYVAHCLFKCLPVSESAYTQNYQTTTKRLRSWVCANWLWIICNNHKHQKFKISETKELYIPGKALLIQSRENRHRLIRTAYKAGGSA